MGVQSMANLPQSSRILLATRATFAQISTTIEKNSILKILLNVAHYAGRMLESNR